MSEGHHTFVLTGDLGLEVWAESPERLYGLADEALMSEIRQTRRNARYLPSLHLPEGITITSDLSAHKPADMLLLVVPSKGIRDTAAAIAALPDDARSAAATASARARSRAPSPVSD